MKQVLETIQIEEKELKPLTRTISILERLKRGNVNLETKQKINEQQMIHGIFHKPSQILRWAHEQKIRKISNYLTDGDNGFCARGIMQQYLAPGSDSPGLYQMDLEMIGVGKHNTFEIIHNVVELNNSKGSTFLDIANYLETKGL